MSNKYSLKETNDFFINFSKRKECTYDSFSYIQNIANQALSGKDYDKLLSLIPYMESGDGYYAFRYIGEARRIFRILSILSLEQKFNKTLFCLDCTSLDSLMEKYVLVLFALRRLSFQLSEDSVEDALFFLRTKALTPFSVYLLTKDELIAPTPALYELILNLYEDLWTNEDITQYLSLVNSVSK